MSSDPFEIGAGPAFERLERLSQRAKDLPNEARQLVDELLEAFAISVEELQVAAEELNQQNAELIATREEIEAQRSRYLNLFEFAPDGYLVTDPKGVIQEVNRAGVVLLGIPKEQLIDKPMALYVTPDERDRFHLYLDRLSKAHGNPVSEAEWEMNFRRRRGTVFPAALTVAPEHNLLGEPTGLRWSLRDISESKRAAERERLLTEIHEQYTIAQEANRLLQALIETMPVGAVIADADGKILFTNTTGREILVTPVKEILNSAQRSYTPFHPDGIPFPLEDMPLTIAMKEKKPVKDVEILIRRVDKSERFILASAAPILDEDGKVISGIAVFQDITEHKKSRSALRQYAERLQVLRQADQVILAAGSLSELVESVLPFTCELAPCQFASVLAFDREAGEVSILGTLANGDIHLGKSVHRMPLDDRWALEELAHGEMIVSENLLTFNGQQTAAEALGAMGVRYIASIPLIAQNELLGVLNLGCEQPIRLEDAQGEVIRQMTGELAIGIRQIQLREALQRHASQLEHKVMERTSALRHSEERFRIILETAVFGIALLDTQGRIIESNMALQTMTGSSEQELKGTTLGSYSCPDAADADVEMMQALGSLESGHYQTEKCYTRKDGEMRWSALTISRVKQTKGDRSWLAVAIMEDITEKKKMQESLARTERLALAGRLGASLAHEINNPLQAVIGCLGLAEEMLEDEREVSRYLEIAMEELGRTADIVTQLRDLGREYGMEARKLVSLNELVEKVLLLTRKRCQNQSVQVEWVPAKTLPLVSLVPERIQQVLLNIVLNAIEAMDAGGLLRISTQLTSQPEGITISVADSGAGIEPGRLPLVFEPFHSTRPEGMGLGLFISKKIVEEHGGRIEATSKPGKGTNFTVWLPA